MSSHLVVNYYFAAGTLAGAIRDMSEEEGNKQMEVRVMCTACGHCVIILCGCSKPLWNG